ncbi:hypothetical protein H5410_031445 [Solanum commersonii]|uniref:Uncharacterized protein n=1 Tax=Solanum commersonii TaxID=4109 RepID=A0A9J5YH63_SOLCO|nr:hypothetical protein H5410_031445 [Solanum commersonii]
MCLPKEEGGVGFRSLFDVSNTIFCKLRWNVKSKPSLWSSFMINKYCKKSPKIHIWWQMGQGNSNFWYDNLTRLGALYHILPDIEEKEIEVKRFVDVEG